MFITKMCFISFERAIPLKTHLLKDVNEVMLKVMNF